MATYRDRFDSVFQSTDMFSSSKKKKVEALAQMIYANDRTQEKEDCLVQAMDEYELMSGSYWDPTHAEYEDALASII